MDQTPKATKRRRGHVLISPPLFLENELRKLAQERGQSISETATALIESALEARKKQGLQRATFIHAGITRVLVERLSSEHFGLEKQQQLLAKIRTYLENELAQLS